MKKAEYTEWIKILADYQGGRPHFSDQTPESLMLLEKLVKIHAPSSIIELGTAHGLSTRLWLAETKDVSLVCVDAGFDPLRGTSAVLPVDFDRLTLIEKWVHDVDLPALWENERRVLLYVDVHSDHEHILDAIHTLPQGSMIIFDDVWRSTKRLRTEEEKEAFREEVVRPQVDFTAPKAIWPLHYADYWKRGGFWGFAEVPVICQWTAANKVTLHWEKGVKIVWFQWPNDKEAS